MSGGDETSPCHGRKWGSVEGLHREMVVMFADKGLSQGWWEQSEVGRIWVGVRRLTFKL